MTVSLWLQGLPHLLNQFGSFGNRLTSQQKCEVFGQYLFRIDDVVGIPSYLFKEVLRILYPVYHRFPSFCSALSFFRGIRPIVR